MKKELFDFIKTKNPYIKEVLDFTIKKDDDDFGAIGEHYVVKCLIYVPDPTIPIHNMLGEIERTCLVDVNEFNNSLKGAKSVIWII